METVPTSSQTLQEETSIHEFFNLVATETLTLFVHLEFGFLTEYEVFAPAYRGEHGTMSHQNSSGASCLASTRTSMAHALSPVNSATTSSGLAVASIVRHHATQSIAFSPTSATSLRTSSPAPRRAGHGRRPARHDFRIDSTDIMALPWNDDASWNYDPTAEQFYSGFGCTVVTTGAKIPIAAEFTDAKRAKQEMVMRVTCDALAIKQSIWMVGDGAYDLLDWHDHLLEAGIMLIAPYNPRNTDAPLDLEYRVEDRIEEYSDDVQLKQSILEETYDWRSQAERTIGACTDCGLGTLGARGRVHTRTQCYLALCLDLSSPSPTWNAETILEAP